MKKETIESLREKIISGKFPTDGEEYGGGGIIVTNDPNWTGHPGDCVILTEYSKEISWLLFELQEMDGNLLPLHYCELIQLYIKRTKSIKNILLGILHYGAA